MLPSTEDRVRSPHAPTITIRPATPADLAATAAWQCRYVPDGLFPQMGERFVRHWHGSFLDSPFGVALVAERAATGSAGSGSPGSSSGLVGFLVGSVDQVRHVEEVVRTHRVTLGLAGLLALAGRPRLATHFIRTRARAYLNRLVRNRSRQAAEPEAPTVPSAPLAGQVAVITAVAVDSAARGSGAGQLLVAAFLEEARAAGAPRAELVAMLGAGSAAPFYDRLGWNAVGEHSSRDGSLARTYRYNLVP